MDQDAIHQLTGQWNWQIWPDNVYYLIYCYYIKYEPNSLFFSTPCTIALHSTSGTKDKRSSWASGIFSCARSHRKLKALAVHVGYHSTDYWDFNCPIHTTGLCRRLGLTRPLAMKKERFCVALAEASGRKPSMATQLQWQHPWYWYLQFNTKYEEEASGFLFSTAGEEWQSGTHLRISLNREQFKVSIGWVQFN